MYEYLIGVGILAIIWALFFIIRKDLQKPMLWGGTVYMIFITAMYPAFWVLTYFIPSIESIVPHYWNPETLFNLGAITGGLAIEDILFMFFVGGLATVIYESLFKKKISVKRSYHPHLKALVFAVLVGAFFLVILQLNPIWGLIASGFGGAIIIVLERKDLAKHSLVGGISFTILYLLSFFLFLNIFPDYITKVYNLKALTGIMILGVPIEELFYALSFGMLWAPLYEYTHGEKCIEEK